MLSILAVSAGITRLFWRLIGDLSLQAKGSLAETDLRSLLEEAQLERATGTLTLARDSRAATLYFVFGSLIHATAEGQSGDDVVLGALSWNDGAFDFDPKAKLPDEESVRSSVSELVARAASNGNSPSPASMAGPAEPEPVAVTWAAPPRAPEPPPAPVAAAVIAPRPDPSSGGEDIPRGVKHRPQPKHGREPIPVPAGQVLYDSLKTSFVDFPRLITTLERESYTGYVRLLTEDAAGLIFFREGVALECVYDAGVEPNVLLGRQALHEFNDEVTHGHGVLDVVSLSPELVDGLHQLTVARPLYTELYAAWVDMGALLRYLEEKRLSGSVMVRGSAGTGVIILDQGRLAGAYTSQSREISDVADGVLALCQEAGAMIEVKTEGDTRISPLDVDEVVGIRRSPPRPPAAQPSASPAQPSASLSQPSASPSPPTPRPLDPAPLPSPPVAGSVSPPPLLPTQMLPTLDLPVNPGLPKGASRAVDWEAIVADLQVLTDEALGNRSRKVKDVLAGADRNQMGLEEAIAQIPTISILFVDSSRLEALASDLRNRLYSDLH